MTPQKGAPAHFAAVFKKYAGCTLAECRARHEWAAADTKIIKIAGGGLLKKSAARKACYVRPFFMT